MVGVGANILERRSVAEVRVDTSQFATVARSHALYVDVALALAAAVAAGAVKLAVIFDVEVDDLKDDK